ncbi:cellulose biosynthesis protein BcsS [Rhodopseudomonas palustris]|uniref:cellulose biosynthesis protein BcsS n=1 Tax=Rhodopseudomonas palustris TaxID=1076 RepID=UPI001FD9D9E1|nr:cellulose biosynthesis protein BcsS [Rhodopseudomonas palustris]
MCAWVVASVLTAGLLGANAQISNINASQATASRTTADQATASQIGESEPARLEAGSLEPDDFGPSDFDPGDFQSSARSGVFDPWGADDAQLSAILSSADIAWTTGPSPADVLSGGAKPDQVLLFGGYDVWRNGMSSYAGVHWARGDPSNDGFILRLSMSNALERYRTPTRTYTTSIFRAALLPGWRFKRGEFELRLFAGPDFENHNFTPDNHESKWRGPHPGLRIAAETWAQPTPQTMLAASLYATTIARGYGFRAAAGWRLIDAFWLGPELSGSRDEFSRQTRFGVHVTGLQSGAFEWSAAIGMVSDSFGRSGTYARLATQLRP